MDFLGLTLLYSYLTTLIQVPLNLMLVGELDIDYVLIVYSALYSALKQIVFFADPGVASSLRPCALGVSVEL